MAMRSPPKNCKLFVSGVDKHSEIAPTYDCGTGSSSLDWILASTGRKVEDTANRRACVVTSKNEKKLNANLATATFNMRWDDRN
eukprot:scaffold25828_cov48-Attheya_sp.AAC.2